jgi:RNA polymerase sigma-70 factor (ECF subfamily)
MVLAVNNELEEKLVGLIIKTRDGDSLAYRQLLETCLPMIRQSTKFHLLRFGQQAFAEDLTQEALLAIHQKLHTYDDKYAFIPWLRAVIRHKIIDFLRKNRIKMVSLDEENGFVLEDVSSKQDATAARDLDVLLKRLKPPAGDIIYMLKVEGISVAELARKFKLSESNIKTIVHRGLAKLSRLVTEERLQTP